MHSRPNHAGCFTLEAINSLGTTYYFYYIYFFTEKQFGFAKFQNLVLAAALGLVYAIASVAGGRFAQRRGYFAALKLGFATMAITMGSAAFAQPLAIQLALMFAGMAAMAITWAALEALVSECDPRRLPRNLGIYNVIWAGLGAVAYFTGGAIIGAVGFRGLFLAATALQILQLTLTFVVERRNSARHVVRHDSASPGPGQEWERRRSPVSPRVFLRMAWFANPFAYLAINTVLAVMPSLANRLQLSVVQAGFICSVWLFTRTASFLWLWLWPGWHYRFRWLVIAFMAMTLSVVAMLLAPNVLVLVIAQTLFGFALGLIYYSSLYYSMDVGETKGEHGGLHEAMIGAGNCVGPGMGAIALRLFPNDPSSSTWAVLALMCCGLGGLLWLWFSRR